MPRLPNGDDKIVAKFGGRLAGGLVANAACASARLGLDAAWSGLLGDDDFGEILLSDFARFGVDASLAEVRPGEASDFCMILLEPGGERTILVVNTIPGPPPLTEGVRAALAAAKIVYSMPYQQDWFSELAETASACRCETALDIESSCPLQGEALTAALRQADIVFCSPGGLKLATGADEAAEGARQILSLGPREVIVTQGAKGAYGITNAETIFSPAFCVPVVDTTGAGDCFHAAYLLGRLRGWTLAERLRFANAAAALSVQKMGAREALPTFQEVETFLTKP